MRDPQTWLELLIAAVAATACTTGTPDAAPMDTTATFVCEPFCDSRECGLDPICGISCGKCVAAAPICNKYGKCVPDCKKQCDGLACGPDGCGDVCGVCPTKTTCSIDQQKCVTLRKSCAGIGVGGCCQGVSLNVWTTDVDKCAPPFDCAHQAEMETRLGKQTNPYCGWNGSVYNCVSKPGLADPSGKEPMACPKE